MITIAALIWIALGIYVGMESHRLLSKLDDLLSDFDEIMDDAERGE